MDLSQIRQLKPGDEVVYLGHEPPMFAMQPGTLAVVVGNAGPDLAEQMHRFGVTDPVEAYKEIEFIIQNNPNRKGQNDGAYDMRHWAHAFNVRIPKFNSVHQAQAWLDQHTTPFQPGV